MPIQADLTSPGEVDYYQVTAPSALLLSSLQVKLTTSGYSDLTGGVSVYDANQNLLGSAVSTDPLNGDVTVTIHNVHPGQSYYIKVAPSRQDAFGIGGYRLNVQWQTLLTTIPNVVNNALTGLLAATNLNNTLGGALALTPVTNDAANGRWNDVVHATLANALDTDYYQVQAPLTADGNSENMIVMAWADTFNNFNPRIRIYDANQHPVAFQVISNSTGLFSIQIPNVVQGANYYVQLSPQNVLGPVTNLFYYLSVQFTEKPVFDYSLLGSNTLTQSLPSDTGTLTMNSARLMSFSLSAQTDQGQSQVSMSIIDSYGNVVLALSADANNPAVTGTVFLTAGTYTVRYRASAPLLTNMPATKYWLYFSILNDPVGTYPTGTSGDPGTTSNGQSSSPDQSNTSYYYTGSNDPNNPGYAYYY
jgi:hypothetical protein